MSQTLGNLANYLEQIQNDYAVIQSLMKRVDVLESTPDATKEMLSEYARDFDTLDRTVKSIITDINNYQNNENQVLKHIQATVEDYHWIIDDSTLEGLKQLVERETGFSLQKYVSAVQKQVIQAEFNKLHTSLQTTVKPLVDANIKRLEEIKKLEEQNLELVQQQNKKISENGSMMLVLMGFLGFLNVGIFLIMFSQIVNAFTTHPVISTIVFVALLAIVAVLAFLVKASWDKQSDDSKESSEDDEEEY